MKEKSDDILGYDVNIPSDLLKQLRNWDYSERVMVLLYFSEKPLTRQELHKRNAFLWIKENWWSGSNFTRDLDKKISAKLLTKENKDSAYKLTQNGIRYVKKIIKEDENDQQ